MIRRVVITGAMIIIAFLLQTTLFQEFSLGLAAPNLLLILTFIFGFMRGKRSGIIVGFFCGLLIDIFFSEVLGFYALLYMIIGYVNGFFNKIFYDEDVTLPLLLLVGSDLSYNMMIYIIRFLLRNRLDFIYYFLNIMLPELIYTIFITVFIYRLILGVNRRLEEYEKRSANKFV